MKVDWLAADSIQREVGVSLVIFPPELLVAYNLQIFHANLSQ
jgi:hypothetical protein